MTDATIPKTDADVQYVDSLHQFFHLPIWDWPIPPNANNRERILIERCQKKFKEAAAAGQGFSAMDFEVTADRLIARLAEIEALRAHIAAHGEDDYRKGYAAGVDVAKAEIAKKDARIADAEIVIPQLVERLEAMDTELESVRKRAVPEGWRMVPVGEKLVKERHEWAVKLTNYVLPGPSGTYHGFEAIERVMPIIMAAPQHLSSTPDWIGEALSLADKGYPWTVEGLLNHLRNIRNGNLDALHRDHTKPKEPT